MATKNRVTKKDIAEIVGASDLVIDGERVDQRSITARRWRSSLADLAMQMGDHVSPSEGMMLRRAATLAYLCERDEASLLKGEEIDQENYRRNAAALGATLIKLGMASKSRDVTKRDARLIDAHAAAVLATYES
ncbi:hypothetical protein IPV08_23515 [Methylobacterium sp. SD274]|uniref:hypothetical protein n=1 Tax=Methylobacterium sp. SD274 TaxID=2782009 RepID=UPI001A97628E|nr:hypothetical protein [Methylobacterium sp. SD274]MBO1022930.1 hypothetical protein [Methylobacterium sp. SD274]